MGSLSSKNRPSASASASERDASTAQPGVAKGANRYGNAAAQEAMLEQEQARLTGQEWSVEDYRPSTGFGMFDLSWDAKSGQLLVVSRLAFVFEDTQPNGERWSAGGGGTFDPELGAWQPGETERWKADAIAEIEAAWSTDVVFRRVDLPQLPPARLRVHIDETSPKDAHFTVVVKKVPEELDSLRDNVNTESGSAELYESAADGVSEVDSVSHVIADPYSSENQDVAKLSREPARFAERSSVLRTSDQSRLNELSHALGQPGRTRFAFNLWGYAAAEEGTAAEQDELSARRIDVVAAELRRHSPETRTDATAFGGRDRETGEVARRVDLFPQAVTTLSTTATHEYGHMLGLPDEYVEDGNEYQRHPGPTDARAEAIAGRSLVATNDQSIMSVGDEVRPHHYVTILEALETMTSTEGRWSVGR